MEITDVKVLALRLERERLIKDCIEAGRVRQALAARPDRAERSRGGGKLHLAWRVADGVLQSRWLGAGFRRGERMPRVGVGGALVMEGAGGR